MWDRAPLAQTMPSAISSASRTMRRRSVASTTGGCSPAPCAARSCSTKRRMSAKGFPGWTPSWACAGPWLTPTPKTNRPPLSSWIQEAVGAKSVACRV